jgi:hypothetical protein
VSPLPSYQQLDSTGSPVAWSSLYGDAFVSILAFLDFHDLPLSVELLSSKEKCRDHSCLGTSLTGRMFTCLEHASISPPRHPLALFRHLTLVQMDFRVTRDTLRLLASVMPALRVLRVIIKLSEVPAADAGASSSSVAAGGAASAAPILTSTHCADDFIFPSTLKELMVTVERELDDDAAGDHAAALVSFVESHLLAPLPRALPRLRSLALWNLPLAASLHSLLTFSPPLDQLHLTDDITFSNVPIEGRWPVDIASIRLLSHQVKRLEVTRMSMVQDFAPEEYFADDSPSLQHPPRMAAAAQALAQPRVPIVRQLQFALRKVPNLTSLEEMNLFQQYERMHFRLLSKLTHLSTSTCASPYKETTGRVWPSSPVVPR